MIKEKGRYENDSWHINYSFDFKSMIALEDLSKGAFGLDICDAAIEAFLLEFKTALKFKIYDERSK